MHGNAVLVYAAYLSLLERLCWTKTDYDLHVCLYDLIYTIVCLCVCHMHIPMCVCVYMAMKYLFFLFCFVFFPVYQYPFYACEENSLCRNITLVNVKLITNHQVWDSHILLSMLVIDHYDSSFLINIRNKSFVTVLLGCLPRMCWLLTRNTISLKLKKKR